MTSCAAGRASSPLQRFWNRRYGLILLGIIVVALGLRLHHLSLLPIFWDESIHLLRAHRAAYGGNLLMDSWGGKLLQPWLTALALLLRLNLEDLLISRVISACLGGFTCLAIYLLASRLYRRPSVGLAAAGLCALSPYLLFFDRMAMADGLLVGLSTLCLLFSLETVRSSRRWPAVALGLCLGLSFITKTYGILFLTYPFLVLLFVPGDRPRCWVLRRFFLSWLIAAPFALMLLLEWKVGFGSLGSKFGVSTAAGGFDPLARWRANLGLVVSAMWTYLTPPVFLAALAELVISLRRHDHRWICLLLVLAASLTIGFFVLATVPKILFPRYVLPAFPFVLIMASRLLARVADWVLALSSASRRATLSSLGAISLVFCGWAMRFDYLLLTDLTQVNWLPVDRWQYIDGWPAGYGTVDGAAFLTDQADHLGSIHVVVTRPQFWDYFFAERTDVDVLAVDLLGIKPETIIEQAAASPHPVFLVLDRPVDDRSAAQILSSARFQEGSLYANFSRPGGESWIEIYRVFP